MANRTADQLLKWGLAHSGDSAAAGGGSRSVTAADGGNSGQNGSGSIAQISADIAAGKRPDLADPGLYNAIMGKSEAQMMQEELAVALDESRDEQDRCTALDNFEMLIEQVDNANNIQNMKMWPPILSLLQSPADAIQLASAWIVGTAVQNNDKAQMAVLGHDPLPRLLELLEHSDSAAVRSKCMYALSGILKHNPAAVRVFADECDGWAKLRGALSDPNITLRRKTAFLLSSLLLQQDDGKEEGSASRSASEPHSGAAAAAPNGVSRATAIAPHASSGGPAGGSGGPGAARAAPLERGPETYASGVAHPDVAAALAASGLLRTLASSLLPPPPADAGADEDEGGAWESVAAYGEDGDQEARADLDYAEKATRALLVYVERASAASANSSSGGSSSSSGPGKADLALLQRVRAELAGPPLDRGSGSGAAASYAARWEELGIERSEWTAFEQRLASLGAA